MDQDTIDLIERLLVQAACVMEDVSAEILVKADDTIIARIETTKVAAERIAGLADAAAALTAN